MKKRNRFPSFKAAPQPNKPWASVAKPAKGTNDSTKKVEFKRRAFEFKASTMELKKSKFNTAITFSNPNNKEMFLYVEKMWWELTKALNGATITITASYPNGLGQTIYNSRKIQQLPKGIRNINLTYSIQEKAEIEVNFECVGFDAGHPHYFIVYKWLDPNPEKKAEEKVKS